MKKKIIFKSLAVLAILAGIGLLTISVIGILDGNHTYDLFKKINVGTAKVYEDVDNNGLDAVKDEYRGIYAVVDQIDGLGLDYARDYLEDTGIVYGLVDTIEATGTVAESIGRIGGIDEARRILDETEAAIDDAQKTYTMISGAGIGEVSSYLVDLESELDRGEDAETARQALDEKYAEADENTAKQIKAFLDLAFKMLESKGNEGTVQYLKEAIDDADLTSLEFARQKVHEQIEAQGAENADDVRQYADTIFRLAVDQGSSEEAVKYIDGMLTLMERQGSIDVKAYLNQVYSESKKENLYKRTYLERIYQAIESNGFEFVKEHGYEICVTTNQENADQVHQFLKLINDALGEKAPDENDPIAWVTQYKEAIDAADSVSDGRTNRYLTDLYDAYDDAVKAVGGKRAPKESAATKIQRAIRSGIEKAEACPGQDKLDKAKEYQRDIWQLFNQVGMEKTKKHLSYACVSAITDRTLRIDALGTRNAKQLEDLTPDMLSRIRGKSRTMIFGIICLIIGIVLMFIRPSENLQPRLSREQRKQAGQHMGLKTSRVVANSLIHALLILISVVWLIPFISITLQSLRVESTYQVGYIMPEKVGFSNYLDLFDTSISRFPTWYLNTFIMALVVAVLQTLFVLCMSYTLSRFRFKMRKPFMRIMLILGMFPGMLSMIILYNVLKDLNMIQENAVPGLILVYVASSGMGYYVSKGFFDTIPKSLDEAARIDGATRLQVLYKIILPLAKPIVIYTVLTAFMGPWGDYVFAKYVAVNTTEGMNAAVGLNTWLSADQIAKRYTMFCAGGVLVAIPVTTLFMCLQKYYVEGVTGGAVKG